MPAVALLSLPFLFLLARRPVLRRLAVRNALRRPRETALVLLGSMLGTAIITGSMVTGDTLDASFRQAAFTHQGPIDELVEFPSREAAAEGAAALRARLPAADVDGVLPIAWAGAAVSTAGPQRRAEPRALLVEVDFGEARRFGGDPGAVGLSGPTPGPGRAAIGEDLAARLDVGPGDQVVAFAYGRSLALTIDRVVPRRGVAGFSVQLSSPSPNLFVPLGTIGSLGAGPAPAAQPRFDVAVSNRGGVLEGAALTDRVTGHIRAALGGASANVNDIKANTLIIAAEQGKQFAELFTVIGLFSVLAGVLLLVNIFVTLAQERKTELGMLRAVGLRRAGLVGSFSLEGWLYALAASAVGALAGLGVGRLIVLVAAGIFGEASADGFELELRFTADAASLANGFAAGFAVALVTVVLTSLGIARLNVIRAIRDLPEPPRTRGQQLRSVVAGAVVASVGGMVFASGLAADQAYAVLGGPALVGLGLVPLLARFVPRRPLVTVTSAAVLLYAAAANDLFPAAFDTAELLVYFEMGVILTGSAVALVSQNQDVIGAFLRRLGGGTRNMALRLGLAYPLARRFRTGLILTMYALVLYTLVTLTVFSHLFARQIDDFTADVSGGFDVRVEANPTSPIPTDAVRAVPGVESVSAITSAPAEFLVGAPGFPTEFEEWWASSPDRELLATGPPALDEIDPRYPSEEAAYESLFTEPDAFIPTRFFLQMGGGPPERNPKPGDRVVVRDPVSGRTRDLRIAALAESGFGNTMALLPPAVMADLFGGRSSPNTLFVATAPGADPDALASRVNGEFLANGASAKSFRQIVDENLGQQRQFFRLMQGYLALGLVVGIAGLGVVMVRAVRERRRQVGVLRSLGFESAAVRRAFLAESAFVAVEGIVIATSLALVTTWRLAGSDAFGGLGFSIPWADLAVVAAGTFVASLLATAAPAQQASRIRPAVALRIAD